MQMQLGFGQALDELLHCLDYTSRIRVNHSLHRHRAMACHLSAEAKAVDVLGERRRAGV
jgi:hypothetical protein